MNRAWMAITTAGLLLAGCSGQASGPISPAPLATFPITGKVLVNGEPADKVQAIFHRTASADDGAPRSAGLSDASGVFEFSTYGKADGVPAGEYALTFTWREWDDYWHKFSGDDRLKGRYADVQKSAVKVAVKPDEPADLGTIELTTE